jgi:hypothetical protein
MSNILNYQSGFTFAPPQGMPIDDALVTFTSSPVAALFNHARCFKTAPREGEIVRLGNPSFGPLSGGGASFMNGGVTHLALYLANNLSASSRGTLGGPAWFMGLSGGTMRYDIPWLMSFRFRNLLGTSPLTGFPVQRIYVGGDAGREILRFEKCPAGKEAYPPYTRGIGFELSRNPTPIDNNLHRIKMFARDGTSTLSGTYTETPYMTARMIISNSISKVYNIVLENNGLGIAKLYLTPWIGEGNPVNLFTTTYVNNINNPYLILSGAGVPKDNGFVSNDWYHIEQAVISEYALSGGAQGGNSGNQLYVDRPLIYFGSLSSLYNY